MPVLNADGYTPVKTPEVGDKITFTIPGDKDPTHIGHINSIDPDTGEIWVGGKMGANQAHKPESLNKSGAGSKFQLRLYRPPADE